MNPRLDPRRWLRYLLAPLDGPLTLLLLILVGYATVVMVSASPERLGMLALNTGVAFVVMWVAARTPPSRMMSAALPLYVVGVLLLIAVALFGDVSKGARRWLNIGVTRIQPSELLKIAVPLTLAWYFQSREGMLRAKDFFIAAGLLLLPVALIAKQPDLGTAILVAAAGFYVLFFAGLAWRLILPVALVGIVGIGAIVAMGDTICQPGVEWPGLREYQKHRVCTLLDPTSDPLGKGFHIIQSTIAIGSGGVFGKGWLQGTQSQLEFLPERHTDFIFAVFSEEFGLVGVALLLVIYLYIISRCLFISMQAQNSFERLLGGALTLTFFVYVFVNMGMVSGILPVVGVPLPLVSYGGTSMVTLMAGFGVLMSIQTHRRLLA